MKRIVLLLFLPMLLNCSSVKPNANIQEWINAQNFTIHKPAEWSPVKTHGYVAYTPFGEKNYYDGYVAVFQYKLQKTHGFDEFVQVQYDEANKAKKIISQEMLSAKNPLGKVFIHKLESLWNGSLYKKDIVYFQHNGNYYNYTFSALEPLYQKYYEDAMSIMRSIMFKEK